MEGIEGCPAVGERHVPAALTIGFSHLEEAMGLPDGFMAILRGDGLEVVSHPIEETLVRGVIFLEDVILGCLLDLDIHGGMNLGEERFGAVWALDFEPLIIDVVVIILLGAGPFAVWAFDPFIYFYAIFGEESRLRPYFRHLAESRGGFSLFPHIGGSSGQSRGLLCDLGRYDPRVSEGGGYGQRHRKGTHGVSCVPFFFQC